MLGCPGHRSISTHNNDNKVKKKFFFFNQNKNTVRFEDKQRA